MPTVSITTKNRAMGQRSGMTSVKPLPFNKIPRTTRRKCVSGRIYPTSCAQPGIPRNGNM